MRALERLRAATAAQHHRLDQRIEATARLVDPQRRAVLVRRYAAFYVPAEAALADHLAAVPDLDFAGRSRARAAGLPEGQEARFPLPASRAEALGMFYVIEGSTLGGRLILRSVREHGIHDPDLAFLDPYGDETGLRWRQFLAVLARDLDGEATMTAEACRGAARAFHHAEQVLCGERE